MNECCQQPNNLIVSKQESRDDRICRRCKVCNRRHFEVKVDPGRVGVMVTGG